MPQASDEQREAWGGHDGIGEDKAIKWLVSRGFKHHPTMRFHWLKPHPDYEPDADDWGAINFLIDEWDWGGIEPAPEDGGAKE